MAVRRGIVNVFNMEIPLAERNCMLAEQAKFLSREIGEAASTIREIERVCLNQKLIRQFPYFLHCAILNN